MGGGVGGVLLRTLIGLGGVWPIFWTPLSAVFLKKSQIFIILNYLFLYNYDMAILYTV